MEKKATSGIMLTLLLVSILFTMLNIIEVACWSNGGYSADPSNPAYGTHDWIAQHALDWLPTKEKEYILDNLAAYLYGTELPDNSAPPDGIGDTIKHHIYYWSDGSLQDDASAVRASQEYVNTVNFLEAKDYAKAAKSAGIMSHYIADMSAFGHVMAGNTDWGAEVHHSDYEYYVNGRTSSYSAEFDSYLSFDGALTTISAYDAAKNLAYDTTFDFDGDLTCVWMDQHYDSNNPTFKNRVGESLNQAVNCLTDVLHTLAAPSVIPATADINPHTSNLRSKGKWITVYIQLPEGYNAVDINATTLLLNGTISAVLEPKYGFVTNSSEYLVDHNNDGILERMVKFDRATVDSFIYNQGIRYGNVALTVNGKLFDGTPFEGTDIVSVNYAGDANNDGAINSLDIGVVNAHWGTIDSNADMNNDGRVNSLDIGIINTNWGQTLP